jgi:surface antigen
MRTNLIPSAAIAVVLTAVTGCASTGYGTNEQVGMVIGGALGGLLGDQVKDRNWRTAAIIAGTMTGAVVGGAVGRSMDATDRMRTGQTLETVRTGVSSSWRNPDTGSEYTVIPTSTYETSTGPCRQYSIDAVVDGRKQKVYGTACRQSDGSWRTQS